MLVAPITSCPFRVITVVTLLLSDGLIVYRKRSVGSDYYIDFSEDGGSSWELAIVSLEADEDSPIILVDSNPSGLRQYVSGRNYYIEEEVSPSVWEIIYMIEQ